mmetsp:Transcript_33961/g.106942  ORF Transcript_33961/g.106942 Transcript_33961/m.106942 type:complete len:267 (+) Transcript_33961:212-1012(+)
MAGRARGQRRPLSMHGRGISVAVCEIQFSSRHWRREEMVSNTQAGDRPVWAASALVVEAEVHSAPQPPILSEQWPDRRHVGWHGGAGRRHRAESALPVLRVGGRYGGLPARFLRVVPPLPPLPKARLVRGRGPGVHASRAGLAAARASACGGYQLVAHPQPSHARALRPRAQQRRPHRLSAHWQGAVRTSLQRLQECHRIAREGVRAGHLYVGGVAGNAPKPPQPARRAAGVQACRRPTAADREPSTSQRRSAKSSCRSAEFVMPS